MYIVKLKAVFRVWYTTIYSKFDWIFLRTVWPHVVALQKSMDMHVKWQETSEVLWKRSPFVLSFPSVVSPATEFGNTSIENKPWTEDTKVEYQYFYNKQKKQRALYVFKNFKIKACNNIWKQQLNTMTLWNHHDIKLLKLCICTCLHGTICQNIMECTRKGWCWSDIFN